MQKIPCSWPRVRPGKANRKAIRTYRVGQPIYRTDYQLQTEGDKTLLKLKITQSEVSESFKMIVPIYMEMPDKRIARLGTVCIVGNKSEEIELPLTFRPRRVFLNEFEDILATVDEH